MMATVFEQEQNNFASSANSLTLGDTVKGSLSSHSDWDFYKVSVAASGVLKLDFSPPTASSDYYFQLGVYDGADKLLAEDFVGNTKTLSLGLPGAGNYYIAVTSSSFFSGGQYALTASIGTGSASSYESESNDTLATANRIVLAQTIKGQLAGSSDVDCYHVSATTAGVLVVDFAAGKTTSGNSFTLDVYDAAGNLLREQSTGHATTLNIAVAAAGDYYVKVKQASSYDGGNYSLTVDNDSFSSLAAKSWSGSAPLAATLSSGHDWYAVSLVAGTSYEFALNGSTSGGGTLADPALALCYSTGALLETNDNLNIWSSGLTPPGATTTADPQIAFTAPATGAYYLMVAGNGATGSYTLSEKTNSQADLTQALVEVQISPNYRWNGAAALATPVTVTYAFLSSTADGEAGFVAMTTTQKQVVRDVLAMYASVAKITFSEVISTQSSADIRFGSSNQAGLSSGITYTSVNSDGSLSQADVFINNTSSSSSQSATSTLSPGGYGYLTLIHEIGHALGLKHPSNYDAGGGSASPPFLPLARDNEKFTVMSYLDNPDSTIHQSTPALLDIAATQYLYGANTSAAGSTHTFTFSNSSAFVSSLLASGSNDTIDISNQTLTSMIFMTPGSLSSIGIGTDGAPARNNVATPYSESLLGVIDGPAADLIVGNALNNTFYGFAGADSIDGGGSNTLVLSATSASFNNAADGQFSNVQSVDASTATAAVTIDAHQQSEALTLLGSAFRDNIIASTGGGSISGGAGNDTLSGSAGNDVAVYASNRTGYATSSAASGHYAIVDKIGSSGTDTLINIDEIRYADGMQNLDIAADAKLITPAQLNSLTELYIAFFNRVPEASGLDYWINTLAGGQSLTQIAESFYGAGVQYSSQTGFSANMTDQDFINVFYKNVLGRPTGADAGGLSYWNGKLADHSSSRWSLAQDILMSAHSFKGDATWGWVADLLDNKVSVGEYNAVSAAVDYLTPQDAVTKGMDIAKLITATDTGAAIKLIGLADLVPYVA
ncbi:MAG: DUF4214 domain-containing protein [Proteobacteria bacterium]|nr:DUF4214 domain-containing protein [Pseudomonadota bacterium]